LGAGHGVHSSENSSPRYRRFGSTRFLHRRLCVAAMLSALSSQPAIAQRSMPLPSNSPVPQARIDPHIVTLPVADGDEIRFTHLSQTQGLSQIRVTDIIQDNQGFMWFGTQYGLDRFDGYEFRVFTHDAENPRSLGCVQIFALYKDSAGTLWIGCADSLVANHAMTSNPHIEAYRLMCSGQYSDALSFAEHSVKGQRVCVPS
jgi:ligand-binding sensor domain-containing protein